MSKRGWLLFLAMAVIWGIPYLLIRVAVRQLDPGVLVFGRTLPAALMLLPLIASRGQLPLLRRNFFWIATFAVVAQRIRRTEDHINARRLVGLAVGALGVAFLVGLDLHGGSLKWISLMMIVGLGYTIGPIILVTKLAHVPGPVVVAGATSFIALCWVPWSIVHWPQHISGETWSCVAVLSVVCTAGAILTLFELV